MSRFADPWARFQQPDPVNICVVWGGLAAATLALAVARKSYALARHWGGW